MINVMSSRFIGMCVAGLASMTYALAVAIAAGVGGMDQELNKDRYSTFEDFKKSGAAPIKQDLKQTITAIEKKKECAYFSREDNQEISFTDFKASHAAWGSARSAATFFLKGFNNHSIGIIPAVKSADCDVVPDNRKLKTNDVDCFVDNFMGRDDVKRKVEAASAGIEKGHIGKINFTPVR